MEMLISNSPSVECKSIDLPEMKKMTISKDAADAFKDFLKRNKEYLQQSPGVFHTDNHSNW